jgi:hypothetical protein
VNLAPRFAVGHFHMQTRLFMPGSDAAARGAPRGRRAARDDGSAAP